MTRAKEKQTGRILTAAALAAALVGLAGGIGPHHTTAVPARHAVLPAADGDPGDNGGDGGGDNGGGDNGGGDTGGDTGGDNGGAANDGQNGGGDTAATPTPPQQSTAADQTAAHRAANARRRAAHAATAARSATAAWNRTGRPDRLIIVRARNIDLVTKGQLTSRVARPAGVTLTLKALARALPPGWLTLNDDGSALLSAALLLNGSSALENGTEVHILRLAGGPSRAGAANIWLSHAQLRLHNIEVTSFDPASQAPLPDSAEGRPFLVAEAGGVLDLADATVRNLGAPLGTAPVKPAPPAPVAPPAPTAGAPAPAPGSPAPGAPPPGAVPSGAPGAPSPAPGVTTPGAATPPPGTAAPVPGMATAAAGTATPVAGAPPAPATPASGPAPVPATRLLVQPGVLFGTGSTGSISRSELTDNTIGVQLTAARDVNLDTVTVDHSRYDGLVLHGDQGTRLRAVQASNNGRNGVMVTGPSTPRPITGISTIANTGFGLAVVRQTQPRITGVSTREDLGGGIRLTGTTGAVLDGSTTSDEPVGVQLNGVNTNSQLTDLHVEGGHNGITLASSVTGAAINGSTIADTNGSGVKVSGANTELRGLSIVGAEAAIRISPSARTVTVVDDSIKNGGDGVLVSAGARDVTVTNPTIDGVSRNGIKSAAANTRVTGGQITGGATGVNARAAITVSGTAISNASNGLRTSPGGVLAADHIDVLGGNVGVKAAPATTVTVSDSRIRSRNSLRGEVTLRGTNIISPPPFNWIAALGVAFVLLALLLEAMAVAKLRRYRRRFAAAGLGSWRPENFATRPGSPAMPAGRPRPPARVDPATTKLPVGARVDPATTKLAVATLPDPPTSKLAVPGGGADPARTTKLRIPGDGEYGSESATTSIATVTRPESGTNEWPETASAATVPVRRVEARPGDQPGPTADHNRPSREDHEDRDGRDGRDEQPGRRDDRGDENQGWQDAPRQH